MSNLIRKYPNTDGTPVITLPEKVFQELEAIRSSGDINMFDRAGVLELAYKLNYYSLVDWMTRNWSDYKGIFSGIRIKRGE